MHFEQNITFLQTALQDCTDQIVKFYVGKGKLNDHQNADLSPLITSQSNAENQHFINRFYLLFI